MQTFDEFTVKSTSRKSADIVEDIVLDEKQTTRKIFRALIVKNENNPQATVKGWIIHQRKSVKGGWQDIKSIDLSTLKSGEGIKLELTSEQIKRLYDGLVKLYLIGNKGIPYGTKKLVVANENTIIQVVDQNHKAVIEQLLQKNLGEEVWVLLKSHDPDLAVRLSFSEIQINRNKSLTNFKTHLDNNDWNEPQWEDFFSKNDWIFGYGLRYQFLGILRRQANYGGETFEGKGKQKGEFLTHTAGSQKFTVLVEIKRPDSPIFDEQEYRNGVIKFSSEFIEGISQVQVNSRTWDKEGSERIHDREKLQKENINTITPKSILVIGNTKELEDSFDKKNSFEVFRQNLHNPEIMTYDELYERASFIVTNAQAKKQKKNVKKFGIK